MEVYIFLSLVRRYVRKKDPLMRHARMPKSFVNISE